MGRSTSIIGIVSTDNSTYKDMLQIKEACERQKIALPIHVERYFDNLEKPVKFTDASVLDTEIWEVRVVDIPTGVDTIQFRHHY